jgi:hypothetical protein
MKTIYGECVSGATQAAVTISRLGRYGCDLVLAKSDAALGDELALWIGAIGPLAITAKLGSGRARHLTAYFTEPLEPAILAHFGA